MKKEKDKLEKLLKPHEYKQILQGLKMSKNTEEFTMMNVYFCIYSLIFPILSFVLAFLNLEYGVSCGDGCSVHSYTVHYVIQTLFIGMGILNIILFLLCKNSLNNKGVCITAIICNCLLNLYMFVLSIWGWFILFVIWPAIITIPLQFILLWYIFLRELLQKENRVFITSLLLGIITCVLLYILI